MERHIEWEIKKYRQACRILDRVRDRYNPCEIHIKNGVHVCKGKKSPIVAYNPVTGEEQKSPLCCYYCQYLTNNGCSVESLACKMWYCDTYSVNYQIKRIITIIMKFIHSESIPYYPDRLSLEDTFKIKYYSKNLSIYFGNTHSPKNK